MNFTEKINNIKIDTIINILDNISKYLITNSLTSNVMKSYDVDFLENIDSKLFNYSEDKNNIFNDIIDLFKIIIQNDCCKKKLLINYMSCIIFIKNGLPLISFNNKNEQEITRCLVIDINTFKNELNKINHNFNIPVTTLGILTALFITTYTGKKYLSS